MRLTINSMAGPARTVSTGAFTFEGLTPYNEEEPSQDWGYRIVADGEVQGMQTYCMLLNGDAFSNIDVSGASNLAIIPPDDFIVEISTNHYSINPAYIDEEYPVGAQAPADYDLGQYAYYYVINERHSTDQEMSITFDEFNLMGPNYISWDPSVKHYKISQLAQILYLPNQNCFGVGTRIGINNLGYDYISTQAVYTIFNCFLGTYSSWSQQPWAPHVGGVLNGQTMFESTPWDAVSYSVDTQIKDPFTIYINGNNLPAQPDYDSSYSGFYIVETEYDGNPYKGFIGIKRNSEGIITDASMWLCGDDFWAGAVKPPYLGPKTDIEGGGGTFRANPGTRKLSEIGTAVQQWNTVKTAAYSAFNKYIMSTTTHLAYDEFLSNLRSDGFLATMRNAYMSPMDNIITCHLLPPTLAPTATSSSSIIYCGSANMSTSTAPLFTEMEVYVDALSGERRGKDGNMEIDLEEYYGAFPDYSNTSVYLHLPFIGMVQLDTAACMKGHIAIAYSCDVMSGDVTAFVEVEDRDKSTFVRYSYKGNCAAPIHLQSFIPFGSQLILKAGETLVQTGINVATGGLAGLVQGGVMAMNSNAAWTNEYQSSLAAEGMSYQTYKQNLLDVPGTAMIQARKAAVKGAVGGINTIGSGFGNALTAGAQTTSSNADVGSVSSALDTKIWLLVVRPVWSNPTYYAAHNGLTSDVGGKVKDYGGLLSVSSIDLSGINCTDEERVELDRMMQNGVYVTDPYEAEKPVGPESGLPTD